MVFTLHQRLIIYVIFNLLRITRAEFDELTETPETYVRHMQNICNRTEETLKGHAAVLLHTLVKQIDGSLAFVTDYISYILAKYLIGKDFEVYTPQFGPFDNSCLMQQTAEVIIDAAMTSLCTISFTVVMSD